MLAYNDIGTYTFVFLYDADHVAVGDDLSSTAIQILSDTGFKPRDDPQLSLDLGAAASGERPIQAHLVALNGGEAFLECKLIDDKGARYVELQLGAAEFYSGSLFSETHYSLPLRDALLACIEKLACLTGFDLGFAVSLGEEEDERDYRKWFSECIEAGRLSLAKLLRHQWLTIHSLYLGAGYLSQHGRHVFLSCPTWKATTPCEGTICLFLDGVNPATALGAEERRSHRREALPYLRNALKNAYTIEG